MNKKISQINPLVWAPFKGTTFLFDNPNPSKNLSLNHDGFYKINCSYDDLMLNFYRLLQLGLSHLGMEALMETYGLCPLPFSSYHVTFLSEMNEGNKASLANSYRHEFEASKAEMLLKNETFYQIRPNNFSENINNGIEFEFKELSTFNGNSVLVAKLQPIEKDKIKYQSLVKRRSKLIDTFLAKFMLSKESISPKTLDFSPHITLGYFAYKHKGEAAKYELKKWNQKICQITEHQTIKFKRFSLYAFNDMVSFFKLNVIEQKKEAVLDF